MYRNYFSFVDDRVKFTNEPRIINYQTMIRYDFLKVYCTLYFIIYHFMSGLFPEKNELYILYAIINFEF